MRHLRLAPPPLIGRWWRDPIFAVALLLPLPVWIGLAWLGVAPPAIPLFQLLLLAPILEELAFRGAIQSSLYRLRPLQAAVWGFSGANGLTALLFATLHAVTRSDPTALLTLFPALIFGLLRDRHQSVLPAILLHSYYNAGLLALPLP